jgi:hypothetical protein
MFTQKSILTSFTPALARHALLQLPAGQLCGNAVAHTAVSVVFLSCSPPWMRSCHKVCCHAARTGGSGCRAAAAGAAAKLAGAEPGAALLLQLEVCTSSRVPSANGSA